jgi:glycerol kinase
MWGGGGAGLPEIPIHISSSNKYNHIQFQADQLGVPVHRPVITESTARGAAFLAGLATGFWTSQDELRESVAIDRTFTPQMDVETRDHLYAGWRKAVARSLDWVEH